MVWMFLFFMFILFYPKYMLYKLIAEMDYCARRLEGYTKKGIDLVAKTSKERGRPKGDPKGKIEDAIEFFLIPPVSLDPFGILKKLEHVLDRAEDRFEEIAQDIAPESDEVWKGNIVSLLKGTIGLNTIAKIVRHYVEFVKETGNLQIAMVVQMQMPMIRKIAEAQMKGVEAISEGRPIGDSIGPLVAANLLKGTGVKEVAKDVVAGEVELGGKKAYVVKAKGPGATLGKLGDAVKSLGEKEKVGRIVTIDASVKLEGEKTGKVCEGIGAAIGDPGPEKAKMEETAVKLGIPLEAFVVKMSIEEAISPLTNNITASVDSAIRAVEDSAARTEKDKVLVVGVGNTCGIGNSFDSVKGMEFPEPEKKKKRKPFAELLLKKFAESMQEKEERREKLEEEREKAKRVKEKAPKVKKKGA